MASSKRSVLILEDDQWFADSLAETLRRQDSSLTVDVVADPAQAMTQIDQSMPFLLIADLHLGARNFLTLLNELASYPDTLQLPKVILSSSGNSLNADDLANYGVVAIYDKRNYDWADLMATVHGCVGNVG